MATPGSNPNAKDFLLPDLGEGLEEAELLEWCVEPGQHVEEFDTLAKMETAKALVEVPAPRGGVIETLHGNAGDVIKVGSPLVSFADGAATEGPRGSENGNRNGSHVTQDREVRRQSEQVPEELEADDGTREDAGTVVGSLSPMGGVSAEAGQVLAAPAVRRLARDLGVDLTRVSGSGIGGRITAGDVRSAASSGNGHGVAVERAAPTPSLEVQSKQADQLAVQPGKLPAPEAPPFTPGDGQETVAIPFRGVRRTIAARLRQSVDRAVHFGVMDEADVTALDAVRKRLIAASGEKLSLLPFVCCAVARVLSGEFGYQLNRLNSRVDDENQQIIQHRRVHLGIAVDTPSGLMVPVLHNATTLGVLEVARKINQLATAARDRSLPSANLQGSTFTISNFGSYAGRFASPVLNYPEVGILGVGRMREGVVVKNGMMGVGKLLPLTLVGDHRVIDGGTTTLALNQIMQLLQSPDQLLPTSI